MTHSNLIWIVSLTVLLAAGMTGGCGDDDGATTSPPTATTCQTSTDCLASGQVCILNSCRPCLGDSACADDPAYGAGATCQADACVSCTGEPGCGDNCELGTDGCGCYGNQTCADGFRCDDAGELCESCPLGAATCACATGDTCTGDLICMDEVCVPAACEAGRLGCPCASEDTCDDGLTCADGGVCAVCSSDIEGCACDADDTCGNDLVCDADETLCRTKLDCADVTCGPNQLCTEGDDGVDAACLSECDAGYRWNGTDLVCEAVPEANCDDGAEGSILALCTAENRACDASGASATCGDCVAGHTEDNGLCRVWTTCASVGCAADNRRCDDVTDADVTCGSCLDNYLEDNGACVLGEPANCDVGAQGSVLAACNADHRACVVSGTSAYCGDCVADFSDVGGVCLAHIDCADLNCDALGRACAGAPVAACTTCLDGLVPADSNDPTSVCQAPAGCTDATCPDGNEFCVEPGPGETQPTCAAYPCVGVNGDRDATQALRIDSTTGAGTCVTCNQSCDAEGETGSYYAYTEQDSGRCICETEQGYYPGGDLVPVLCDADQDGWISEVAAAVLNGDDPYLAANAKCEARTIDRFRLVNEWGQKRDVMICSDGASLGFTPAKSCTQDAECGDDTAMARCDDTTNMCVCSLAPPDGAWTIQLIEPARNDLQKNLETPSVLVPEHLGRINGSVGRRPRAEEVNGLTKGCVSEAGDYNGNDIPDVFEYHDNPPAAGWTDEQGIYASFSYMMELHHARFENTDGTTAFRPVPGRYVIEERSRCDADFPVKYDTTVSSDTSDYWRSCTRGRDSAYDAEQPTIGHDFGQFMCNSSTGSCPIEPYVAGDQVAGFPPDHGLCDILDQGVSVADEPWRGMTHHAQFKCAVIDAAGDITASSEVNRLSTAQLKQAGNSALWQFNRCHVACPVGDENCDSDCYDREGISCTVNSMCSDGYSCLRGACVKPRPCATSSVPGDGRNPSRMNVVCEAVDAKAGNAVPSVDFDDVGFVAARYDTSNETDYKRGCIAESKQDIDWQPMCPSYVAPSEAIPGVFPQHYLGGSTPPTSNADNFGEINCLCSENFGGVACDEGCGVSGATRDGVNAQYSNVMDIQYREGIWVCGGPGITGYTQPFTAGNGAFSSKADSTGRVWTVKGEFPSNGIEKTRTCKTVNGHEICVY